MAKKNGAEAEPETGNPEERLRPAIHLSREQRQGLTAEMLQQAEAGVVQAWMNYVRTKAALAVLEAECQKL